MKQKGHGKKKCVYPCLLLSLSILIVAAVGCNESNGFSMAQFFPLSSGWETDIWTFFTDELEKQINGTSIKPMIDTSSGKAYYWSSDEYGLRLHAVWALGTQIVYYSQPVKIAGGVCDVGDVHQTTYTLSNDSQNTQYVFTSELLGAESITTTAGTFTDCLKFRFHLYPVGSLPEDYGYETVWLGKNTGFVRAEADDNSLSELFVEKGKMRQLVSFSTTPTRISAEEADVRDAYKQWIEYWNEKDISSIGDMTHDAYFESCRNKDSALEYWNDFLSDTSDYKYFATIEEVILNGNNAYVVAEFLESYTDINGENATRRWGRSSVRMVRLHGEWQIYGNQFDVYPSWISVYPRRTPSSITFALPVEIVDCATGEWAETSDQIAALQLTGPPDSGVVDLELVDTWDPDEYWSGFWPTLDMSSAKNGFYTFHITDINGNYLLYTDYLVTASGLDAPVQLSPEDGVTGMPIEITFGWQAVTYANSYMLEVYEVDTVTGNLGTKVVSEKTDQTSYTATLDSGKSYDWRVRARYNDPNDGDLYDSESRSSFRTLSTSSNQ